MLFDVTLNLHVDLIPTLPSEIILLEALVKSRHLSSQGHSKDLF